MAATGLPHVRRDDRADADARQAQRWSSTGRPEGLDFSPLFSQAARCRRGVAIYNSEPQDHELDKVLDRKLIAQAQAALDRGAPVQDRSRRSANTDRAAGAMLSGEVAKRYGHAGLPDDTMHVQLKGTAGQSFGAWLARGITLRA